MFMEESDLPSPKAKTTDIVLDMMSSVILYGMSALTCKLYVSAGKFVLRHLLLLAVLKRATNSCIPRSGQRCVHEMWQGYRTVSHMCRQSVHKPQQCYVLLPAPLSACYFDTQIGYNGVHPQRRFAHGDLVHVSCNGTPSLEVFNVLHSWHSFQPAALIRTCPSWHGLHEMQWASRNKRLRSRPQTISQLPIQGSSLHRDNEA